MKGVGAVNVPLRSNKRLHQTLGASFVEMFQNRCCEGVADAGQFREGLDGCFPEPRDAPECCQKGLLLCGAHAWDVIKGALRDTAAKEEFVVAVGDAVGLVADPLEQAEGSRVLVEADGG